MNQLLKAFSVISLFIIMTSCQTESDNMRRFTFAAFNTTADAVDFEKIQSDQTLLEILKKSGVVNFDFCTMDTISYLVLDMEANFNLDQTRALFKKLSEDHNSLSSIAEIIDGKYELLNRIYKLEQKVEYTAEEGQLIPYQKEDFARFVLTLEIINDPVLAEDYVKVHGIGKAWPEITQNMKTVGIHEMELYLTGYRAFLIMDTKPDFNWDTDGKKWGELPRESEWQAHVAKFQKVDPDSKAAEKWKTMNTISMR